MSREMIVGGEHMVGANRHHDYDELMELGAEPATSRQRAPVHQVQHEVHPAHLPQHHPQHGGHAPPPVVVKFSFARPFAANPNASRGPNRR